ncbi:MAG: hypothetical protein ABIP06_12650 [Pyrinomonadaceae bacterium]
MYNEDYLHAVGEKFRPKPDNLKLLLVAGAALFSAIILTALLAGFYWNGEWHNLKTPTGESISHSENHSTENHTTDPAETHKEVPGEKPAESH